MNTESDNFNTPRHTKRLGLRRSGKNIKHNEKNSTGSAAKCTTIEIETSTSSFKSGLPQSDVKVNYKHLEHCDSASTPGTPKNAGCTELRRLSVSTNCRPYRLALSKKVREKMTKKRLEFFLANEIQKDEEKEMQVENSQEKDDLTEKGLKSREELLQLIENASKELDSRQQHMNKVRELQQAIDVWKVGFSSALHDLQQKIEPRLETEAILDSLHIPQEMIKYISDSF